MLKRTLLYALLFFYLAVQLKPVTAIVQDFIAHTFFKMQHMATIHYENGKYHLHTELETISKEESGTTKNKALNIEKQETNPQHISHSLKIITLTQCQQVSFVGFPKAELKSGFITLECPPPNPKIISQIS